MKEKLGTASAKVKSIWGGFSPLLRWGLIIWLAATIIVAAIFLITSNKSDMTPLYSNLTPAETGEIKAAIEEKGILAEVSADGKTISVPEAEVANLKVALAAEGIPKNGNVNYSIFSDNMGMGMTDRHFDVVERDAMQNELAGLIRGIEGVSDANVMITLPKENVWITDEEQSATASVVVQSTAGAAMDQKQINGLYHLISKSVPNLPVDGIVIMDGNGMALEMVEQGAIDTALSQYQQHREIQKDIEKDIQRELQQMLGLLLGRDKVVVSVMASVDFTKEKREEQLVEAPDAENAEGLEISVERIVESFSNEGAAAEEPAGTGDGEIANYPAGGEGGTSESERTEERINREVDRIHRQIETSPYVIDDLTINVGVEPPIPGNTASLTQQHIEDIRNLLTNTVGAAMSMNGEVLDQGQLADRISIFATEFQGKPVVEEEPPVTSWFSAIPAYVWWAIGAGFVLLVIGITVLALRSRKERRELEESFAFEPIDQPAAASTTVNAAIVNGEEGEEDGDLSEFDSRTNPKRKTIEKLAKGRPEDFVRLMRTWMADD